MKNIIKTPTITIFGEKFNIWNIKNKNKVVTKDAMLPGILVILPIPKRVTNKKLNLLSII
tara:strand:+ start:38 stop:217 length:180 start_codon:yes stop_codon:yes gene_type:complete